MTLMETASYDNLIAGDFPIVTTRGTLLSGENLERGALLGKITASGASQDKLKQCDSTNSDGSEDPYAILVDDCDASSADTTCTIYLAGEFNSAEIGVVSGDDIDDFADDLRALGIFVKTTIGD